MAVPGQALADHLAGQHVQGREQASWCRCACSHGSSCRPDPCHHRQRGCVRSSACTGDFSSMHSTIAFSGGFRYRPTTSMSLSSNFGSLDTLNVSTRCGCSPARGPNPLHRGRTDTPPAWPSCGTTSAWHPAGVVVVVSLTISANGLLADRGFAAPTFADLAQTGQPVLGEPLAPGPHRRRRHSDLLGDHRVRHPVGGQQQHPRPQHLPIRRRLRPATNLSNVSRSPSRQRQRRCWCHHTARLPKN